MRRMTIYVPERLHHAIVAHAEANGQKISMFISSQLAHLLEEKPPAPPSPEFMRALAEAKWKRKANQP